MTEPEAPPIRTLRPDQVPVIFRRDFLSLELRDELFAHALAHQAEFEPTLVGNNILRPESRISTRLRDLGDLKRVLREHVRSRLPDLTASLGMRQFGSSWIEVEMVAHGDGAFYTKHIDTKVRPGRTTRALSAVYYFFRRPQGFSGGALRLFRIPRGNGNGFLDVFPEDNLLVAFPAFAPHEVRPVSCPSGRFEDNRFAINIWTHMGKPGPAAAPAA